MKENVKKVQREQLETKHRAEAERAAFEHHLHVSRLNQRHVALQSQFDEFKKSMRRKFHAAKSKKSVAQKARHVFRRFGFFTTFFFDR